MAGPRLIDLRTDLKSLRYGSDKPYITKDINNPPSSNQTGMQITKRVDDLSRIAQMLVDRPGLKFIGNQALLQQVDIQDKLQKSRDSGKTLAGAIIQQTLGTVKQTAKILGSTLAQVPVNGTGTHFVYAFRTDTYLQPSGGNQRSAFAQFFGAGGVEGAPLALRGEEIKGEVQSKFGDKTLQGEFKVNVNSEYDYDEYFNTVRTGDEGKINAQAGKPVTISGSKETTLTQGALGVSNQNITASLTNPADELGLLQPTTSTYKRETPYGKNSSNYLNGTAEFSTTGSVFYTEEAGEETGVKLEVLPINQIDLDTRENTNSEIITTEQFIKDKYNSQAKYYELQKGRTIAGSEKNVIKEKRVNLGDQGKISFDRSAYSNTDPDTQDKLNLLDVSNTRIDGTNSARDLAKFYFEIITPDESKFLHFRAFIDSIDDSYNADWQGFKYVGRADSFYTYGGFERDINISFKIAAATRAEMKPLYRKMVYLASSTAPTYGGQGFMRGTLARMTIGSYFSQLPGVITSVKYNLIDDMPWEISMQSPEQGGDSDVQELPMGLQCNVSFKVIHDFAPQTGLFHYFTNPNPVNAQDFLK
jgi:hypothetical protein